MQAAADAALPPADVCVRMCCNSSSDVLKLLPHNDAALADSVAAVAGDEGDCTWPPGITQLQVYGRATGA